MCDSLYTVSAQVRAMSRIFAYCRVSTNTQTPDNQIREIEAAGFKIEPHRIVTETISGSVEAMQRPLFSRLLDKLEKGDTLIVTKIDRCGRNAMDVRKTIEDLSNRGVRVHCLQLGGTDLNSAAGKIIMGVICQIAEFEKDLLIERVNAGLERAKSQGRTLGRPSRLSIQQKNEIRKRKENGETIYALAKAFDVDRRLIQRTLAAV